MADSSADRDPLDRLAEEFVARFRAGERPALSEYAARLPDRAEEVRELFPALVELEELKPNTSDHTGDYTPAIGPADPERVGEFRILRRVGVGGMGAVYEAVQESLGRHVALKLLPLDAVADPKRLERFRREAKAAAKLLHSNIVPVYGTGEADGRHYYAMQFIAGHPLDAVIDEVKRLKDQSAATTPRAVTEVAAALATGTFPSPAVDADATVAGSPAATGSVGVPSPSSASPSLSDGGRAYWATVAPLGAQAADALVYAHGQGVLHRDIKPANLLLDLQGTVWVADFGLAKSTDADDLTHTGDVIGTLRYMAPERFEGQGDQRADIYALGLTLYELLALRPAFVADTRAKLVEQAIAADPPKPRSVNPAIPKDLETIVLKAIARDPVMRYQTAGELADDLRRYLEDRSILARRATPFEQAWRWCRRNPAVAGLAAAVVCVLSAGVLVSSLLALGQRSARLAEGVERQKATDAQLAAEAEGAKTKAALADSYAATGLTASDPAEAMVWLAHAAEVAGAGTDRERLNRERLVRWDADTPKPVRVLDHKDDTMLQRMEFHPAGRHLMTKNTRSTDWKGRWRLWDLESGAEVAWPAGHTNVSAAAFDPTGRHVAFGTEQGEFVLATFPAGEVVFSAKREVPILSVTFDASGDRLAFARGIHIEYVDVPTRTLRPQKSCRSSAGLTMTPERERRMDQTPNNMEIGFAPTGEWLYATVGPELWVFTWFDPTVIKWLAARSYEPSAPKDVYNRPPTSPQFADDGRTLFLGYRGEPDRQIVASGYRVLAFDPIQSRLVTELLPDGGWKDRLANYALSPDRRHAFVVTNNTQHIMDLRTGRPVRDKIDWSGGDKGTALSQAFSPDGLTLYTAWTDGQVRQHTVATGLVSGPPLRLSQRVENVAVSPDGSHLATAEPGGLVRLWRLKAQGGGFDLPLVGRYSMTRFSPDGKYVFPTGSNQRESSTSSVRVYDVRTREPIGPPLTIQLVACADATADAGLLAVGGLSDEKKVNSNGTTTLGEYEIANLNPGSLFNTWRSKVWLWDPRTGRQACPPISLTHPIRSLKLHPDGTAVAVLTADGAVAVYEVPSGKPLRSWKAHEPFFQGNHFVNNGELKFDPTGKYLATYGPNDCTANVWDPATGQLVVALKHPKKAEYQKVHDVTFSPDGRRAFTTCWTDNAVRSWDLPSGEPAGPPLVHADWPFMVDLHPDGTTLVSACRDGAAHVWNWKTGKELLAGLRHDGEVAGVAYTPDGATIVTAGHDERVRLWDAATGRPVAPPVRTEGRALVPVVSKDGRFVAVGGQMPRPPVIDLRPEVAPMTTAGVEMRAGSRFDAAGLTRIPTAEWLARWDADPSLHADPLPPAAESAADWHRLSLAECRGDWKAVAAVAERLMTRQPDNWSLISRRFRELGELGDYAAAYDLLKNAPWFLYTREKENIPLDQFLLLRARSVLNLRLGQSVQRDLNVSSLLTNFGDLREPKLFSQIPWTWALQDPYSSGRVNPFGDRSNTELDLIDLTKKARGSDVTEPRYYRLAALMNYRVAATASSLESSRVTLRAGLDRITDIEAQTNATPQEVDHVILALIQHALGQTAEAKASLELAECIWAAALHDNPTARTYDWLERLERELLFEEARRTLKSAPRFAERTAPPRRPRTPRPIPRPPKTASAPATRPRPGRCSPPTVTG